MPTKILRSSRGHSWLGFFDEPNSEWNEFAVVGDQNLIYSEGHTRSRRGWDSGGPFECHKHTYTETSSLGEMAYLASPFGTYRYRGPQYAHTESTNPSSSLWPDVVASPDFILVPAGATAISRTLPTNPTANLAQFLGELREGLPRRFGVDFFRSRALAAKKAGGDYLNYEFGWKPLVKDVRSFAHAVRDSDRILDRYEKGSGLRVRRRYEFPVETTVDTFDHGLDTPRPLLVTPQYINYLGAKTERVVETRRVWFSGCYTYFLPPSNTGGRKGWLQRANKLLGVRITPETLWNLAPWSWASDWFANTGDVMKNISAFSHDGLVMQYGYVMEKITKSRTISLAGIRYATAPGPHDFSQTWTTTSMKRLEASPFGFGLNPNWSSFTSRQIAIATALGLQRRSR